MVDMMQGGRLWPPQLLDAPIRRELDIINTFFFRQSALDGACTLVLAYGSTSQVLRQRT